MKLKNSKVGEFVPVTSKLGLYYGGYQNALGDVGVSKFYRDRSCVVTAFTNSYLYMYHPDEKFTLEEYNKYHYDFYKKIRPHINGVPTVEALNRRVNRIRRDRNLNLYAHIMQEFFVRRHSTEEKIAFINQGLSKNCPVIFINWMSRNVKVLAHHGVTITECNDMGDYHELVISSWGRVYKINFEIFDRQIKSYSGLIYFERNDYEIHQS
ncbi:hypothetical protein JNO63_04325 [Anaerococcus sp. mt242]|uniref:hypothetical protein n=1 Tax=Anaerococcus sp. mt242 TaxID=2661917 RepID=UPI0019323DFF|nr:hypothetical protein [Anaerococcus sp. mt242]MBM0046313.1 hypothetical protein [Anaerococcus sp. mt242]